MNGEGHRNLGCLLDIHFIVESLERHECESFSLAVVIVVHPILTQTPVD